MNNVSQRMIKWQWPNVKHYPALAWREWGRSQNSW